MARVNKSTKHQAALLQAKRFNLAIAGLAAVLLVGIGYYIISSFAATGSATLSLTPATAIANNGTTFTVDVREDSGTAPVNAVQVNLTYPAAQLQFISIDATTSGFGLEAQSTGGSGTITLARGVNGGQAPLTGSQLVARVTFKSLMTTGSATVGFATGSAVVSSVDNTALALTTAGGTYSPDTTPPSAPTSLRTTTSDGSSISIAWNASTDNVAVTGYNVYRDSVKIASSVALTYVDTGLGMGTTHTYQVTALDAASNESAKSATLTASTKDTVAPTVPTGLTLQALAYNQVKLTWTASTDTGGSGLAGYRVYRNGGATSVGASTTATYTDTGLSGSTSYSYTVSAYDGAGNESGKSTSSNVTTPAPPDTTPPTTPTSFIKTGSSLTGISLSWAASTDDRGVTGYQLLRNGTQIATPAGTSYSDSGLSYGTTYTYTLTAHDAAGNVSAAATLSAATLPLKVGDVDHNNAVDIYDLSIMLSHWNQVYADADLNHNNLVDIFDLSMLLSNWGI